VVVLSDQEIAQRKEVVDLIDTSRFTLVERVRPGPGELEPYERFRLTPSGVSPISHPGMKGGNYVGAGIEHNEHGDPTASGSLHQRMNEKRIRKFDRLCQRDDLFRIEGDPSAPLALVSWGSSAGVCREALALATAEGLRVKLLVPYLLYPVSEGIYRRFFATVKAGLVVEQSYLGQLYRVLRMMTDVPAGLTSFSRSGANPFRPAEIVRELRDRALAFEQREAEARSPRE
jgi:2-oxoglutarate ferredoxin oxidoreductase subunit alpha